MPKHVRSGGTHLLGFVSQQHSSVDTSQRSRAAGDTVSNFSGAGIEPQTLRNDSSVLNYCANIKKNIAKAILVEP